MLFKILLLTMYNHCFCLCKPLQHRIVSVLFSLLLLFSWHCVWSSCVVFNALFRSILMIHREKKIKTTFFVWSIEILCREKRIFPVFNHFFTDRFLFCSQHIGFLFFFCSVLWLLFPWCLSKHKTLYTIYEQKQVHYCLFNNWIFFQYISSLNAQKECHSNFFSFVGIWRLQCWRWWWWQIWKDRIAALGFNYSALCTSTNPMIYRKLNCIYNSQHYIPIGQLFKHIKCWCVAEFANIYGFISMIQHDSYCTVLWYASRKKFMI